MQKTIIECDGCKKEVKPEEKRYMVEAYNSDTETEEGQNDELNFDLDFCAECFGKFRSANQ